MRIKGSLAFRKVIQAKEMESPSTRKGCFPEEDNGLASIAVAEHGSSNHHHHHHHLLLSRPLCTPRKTNPRKIASFSSSRSARFEEQQQPYFLDACFLCKKPLGGNTDIFMYRGDTAFCSEECRTEQIDKDEGKEKNWKAGVSIKTQKEKPSSSKKNYPFQSGALAAA